MSEEQNNNLSEHEACAQVETPEQEQTEGQAETAASDELTQEADTPTAAEPSLEEQLAQLRDTHLRLMAEYDNYRKRTLKEKSDLIRHGGEKALRDLIPVVDDLDIALANIDATEDIQAVRQGVHLIYSKFVDYLQRQGVRAIETTDAAFDEELHEAIATFPAPTEEQRGRIIDCVKKGYMLHDKVLRHASVVVGQ